MDKFAKIALDEYNSEENIIHQGGVNGNPFWNINSSQFIYVPAFEFPKTPAANEFLYTATDCFGQVHTFTADTPVATDGGDPANSEYITQASTITAPSRHTAAKDFINDFPIWDVSSPAKAANGMGAIAT